MDEGLLSRLLTPTQASLARSKSAAALSAEGTDSPGNVQIEDPDKEEGWLDLLSLNDCKHVNMLSSTSALSIRYYLILCCRPSVWLKLLL